MEKFSSLPQVHIKNVDFVKRKLAKISADGSDLLQVLSDFDFTISRSRLADGSDAWTTYSAFDLKCGLIREELADKLSQLRDHFRPIEFDYSLPLEVKIPYMEEW
ncbi:unnamed protein product [Soboliphyme baturini]|uniref:5'-nucleotidase n=1 Tax=Soboliphyme baturini TaxID=241478 RepID=A0A183IGB2_9BILA|nr:unnamed protein product [Soboliphyme baturini]